MCRLRSDAFPGNPALVQNLKYLYEFLLRLTDALGHAYVSVSLVCSRRRPRPPRRPLVDLDSLEPSGRVASLAASKVRGVATAKAKASVAAVAAGQRKEARMEGKGENTRRQIEGGNPTSLSQLKKRL